jgi:toxin HigB-1
MIGGFRHKGLKLLYEANDRSRLPAEHVGRIRVILAVLDGADRPEDADVHSFRLHRLRGERAGSWAVTVRANWRIVFRFEEGRALDIDLVDYH